jgi:capsular polysaccharide biosynthesis protein
MNEVNMLDLLFVWRLVKRWWWVMMIPPLVVTVLYLPSILRAPTGSVGFYTQFRYTASQTNSNLPNRDGDFQDVWIASEYAVNAFTEWVRSSSFRQEIQSVLGADVDLAGFNVVSDNARSVGQVQMSHPNEQTLTQAAQATIFILRTRNKDYFPQLGEQNAQVDILDTPVIVPAPPPIIDRFQPFVRIGLALLGAIGLAILLEYLDNKVHYADELERKGIRVLGNIPK